MRRLHWVVYNAVLAAVLIPLYFLIPMTHSTLKGMAGAGVVGALVVGIMDGQVPLPDQGGQSPLTE